MRIVITGADGQLGWELRLALSGRAEVVGLDLPAFDICHADCSETLAAQRPDWVIHAAAMTDVDGCEREPGRAAAVNTEGTRRVAESCRATGAGLVYLSTDFVFDGRKSVPYIEDDVPAPLSVYGQSKLMGEAAVRAVAPRWAIVRTAWLFGVHGKNFVKAMVQKAAAGEALRVVDDQTGSPTYARDLAAAVADLVHRGLGGVFHLTNGGSCSWFMFARAILRASGFPEAPIVPITSEELNRPARRPTYSVLDRNAWVRAGGEGLRPWPAALEAMLTAWREAGATAVPPFPQRP